MVAGTTAGTSVRNFVGLQLSAIAAGRRLKAMLDSAQYGAPADWQEVANELGLSGPNALTQAQSVWTIISTAMTVLDVPATAELARLDQG